MTREEFLKCLECVDSVASPLISSRALRIADHDAEQRQEIARLREALGNIVEGEGLWTKNDMAHEAQQALK